jgi:phosphoribosyl-ATP pyrophosphohydrolase
MTISDIAFLEDLERIIHTRMHEPTDESYTARLVQSGGRRVAQKVGEEGVELALAAAGGDPNEVIDEAADLVFHLMVLLADQKLRLKDVCERLKTRHHGS